MSRDDMGDVSADTVAVEADLVEADLVDFDLLTNLEKIRARSAGWRAPGDQARPPCSRPVPGRPFLCPVRDRNLGQS